MEVAIEMAVPPRDGKGAAGPKTSLGASKKWSLRKVTSLMSPLPLPASVSRRTAGGGCCERPSGAALSAFSLKLELAFRTALAVALSTGLSFFYNWSQTLTWFSIMLSIGGVKKSMGETLVAASDLWVGGAATVPLIYLVSLLRFDKVLTALSLFVAMVVLVWLPWIDDAGKRMGGIFLTVTTLICAVSPEATYAGYLANLFKSLAFANVFNLLCLLIPYPRMAHRLCRRKLVDMEEVHVALLTAFLQAFNLSEDVHHSTIDHLYAELVGMMQYLRENLVHVHWEMTLLRCKSSSWRRLSGFLSALEATLELMEGMRTTVAKLVPNTTHHEFLAFLSKPMGGLIKDMTVLLRHSYHDVRLTLETCGGCGCRPSEAPRDYARYLAHVNERLQVLMDEYIKARVSVIYGMQVLEPCEDASQAADLRELPPRDGSTMRLGVRRRGNSGGSADSLGETSLSETDASPRASPTPPLPPAQRNRRHYDFGAGDVVLPLLQRRASKELVFSNFLQDYSKLGYSNLLPRNAFLLDLRLLAEALPSIVRAATGQGDIEEKRPTPFGQEGLGSRWTKYVPSVYPCPTWPEIVARWRQPFKVAIATIISSIAVLSRHANMKLGPSTIWGVIALCQTMSPYPSSSFKSGFNRIQGTVLGSIYGLAVMEWLGLSTRLELLASLTVWVFLCGFNRNSHAYGETAMVAAVTAPVIVVGPILGGKGALVRIQQTILGCVIYVAVDNIFWPVRAKLDLRRELQWSIEAVGLLWHHTLSIFLEEATPEVISAAKTIKAQLRASLHKQERYITLAAEEPELWHKPFHASAYHHVVKALLEVDRSMAMLCRAGSAFPPSLGARDREMLASIQDQVERLGHVTASALQEAATAVQDMTTRRQTRRHDGAVQCGASPPLSLLRLRTEYLQLQDFIDDYMRAHVLRWREKDESDFILTSPTFIISLNGMIFAMEGIGDALVKVGHAIRELVEREKTNTY